MMEGNHYVEEEDRLNIVPESRDLLAQNLEGIEEALTDIIPPSVQEALYTLYISPSVPVVVRFKRTQKVASARLGITMSSGDMTVRYVRSPFAWT